MLPELHAHVTPGTTKPPTDGTDASLGTTWTDLANERF
jgi:hypothetical protein